MSAQSFSRSQFRPGGLLPVFGNLPLPDYGRVARHPPQIGGKRLILDETSSSASWLLARCWRSDASVDLAECRGGSALLLLGALHFRCHWDPCALAAHGAARTSSIECCGSVIHADSQVVCSALLFACIAFASTGTPPADIKEYECPHSEHASA